VQLEKACSASEVLGPFGKNCMSLDFRWMGRKAGRWSSLACHGMLASALLSATACKPLEPESPKAGDHVRPVWASSFSHQNPGKMSTVSVYEHFDSDQNGLIITGKRIRFRVDHSLVDRFNRRDGPTIRLALSFDMNTLGPVAFGSSTSVSAALVDNAIGGNLTRENITSSAGPFGVIGRVPPHSLKPRTQAVCGLDAFDVPSGEAFLASKESYPLTPGAERFSKEYGGSMVFALKGAGDTYIDIISCSRYSPTCQSTSSYRGWPARIVFKNEYICNYSKIKSGAKQLFDQFYVDETERSPGQVERRWSPSEIAD